MRDLIKYISCLIQSTVFLMIFFSSNAMGQKKAETSKTVKIAVVDTKLINLSNKDAKIIINQPYSNKEFKTASFEKHGQLVTNIITKQINRDSSLVFNPEIFFYGGMGTDDSFPAEMAGLKKAIDNDVKIINLSITGTDIIEEEFELIKKASDKGILIVAVAGNEKTRLSWNSPKSFPCQSKIKNLICVGSATRDGISSFSNFGDGVNIYTDGVYNQNERGTSYSAPVIARALAIAINNFNTSPNKAIEYLYESSNLINTKYGVIRLFDEESFLKIASGN